MYPKVQNSGMSVFFFIFLAGLFYEPGSALNPRLSQHHRSVTLSEQGSANYNSYQHNEPISIYHQISYFFMSLFLLVLIAQLFFIIYRIVRSFIESSAKKPNRKPHRFVNVFGRLTKKINLNEINPLLESCNEIIKTKITPFNTIVMMHSDGQRVRIKLFKKNRKIHFFNCEDVDNFLTVSNRFVQILRGFSKDLPDLQVDNIAVSYGINFKLPTKINCHDFYQEIKRIQNISDICPDICDENRPSILIMVYEKVKVTINSNGVVKIKDAETYSDVNAIYRLVKNIYKQYELRL